MRRKVQNHLKNQLKHIYISPLEECNYHCQICYTQKTKSQLTKQEILNFIKNYQVIQTLESITFCGGEVFLLDYFTSLVNKLIQQGLFIQIITNASIDKLAAIKTPNSVNLIVSLDGPKKIHDLNRGQGSFNKVINFLKKAHYLGFHTEIFTIVFQENYQLLKEFKKEIQDKLGFAINFTFHPRKSLNYLASHPVSNIKGDTNNFKFLLAQQLSELLQKHSTFPPLTLGCYQISLMSDKKIYSCCEGIKSLGTINDNPKKIRDKFNNCLEKLPNYLTNTLACPEPDFLCGLKDIYQQIYEK